MSTPELPTKLLPLIYVATPLSDITPEGVAQNTAFAEQVCRMVSMCGGAPYAPHLLLPRFLNDKVMAERAMGIAAGLRVLSHCDEVWAILPPWRDALSTGMKAEVEMAMLLGIPVRVCMGPPELQYHLDRLQAGQVLRRAA